MSRVLIVDDFADAREMLQVVLRGAGYEVLAAADGAEAVRLAIEHVPDAIIMDIFLPDIDGCEATRQIKSNITTSRVPVVAYTARLEPYEEEKHLFHAVCVKPCPPDSILATVSEVLANRPHA